MLKAFSYICPSRQVRDNSGSRRRLVLTDHMMGADQQELEQIQ